MSSLQITKKQTKKALSLGLALAVTATAGIAAGEGFAASAATALQDNGCFLSQTTVEWGSTVRAFADFTGGVGSYTYKYSLREDGEDWEDVGDVTDQESCDIKLPYDPGFYTVRVAAWDSKGTYASKYLSLTVYREYDNNFREYYSELSTNSTWAGWTITAEPWFTGGAEPYKYKYSYRNGNGAWVDVTNYTTNTKQKIKMPNAPGNYTVRIASLDALGAYASKYLPLQVKKDTKQKFEQYGSSLSSTSTWANWTITAKAGFKGGVKPYKYRYSIKLASESSFTDISDGYVTNPTYKIKQSDPGRYVVRISALDGAGKYASKYINLTVKKDYGGTIRDNGSTLSGSHAFVNDYYNASAVFTGGVAPYTYKFDVKLGNGSWKTVQNYSDKSYAKINTNSQNGSYTVRVCAKDAKGKYASKYLKIYVMKPKTSLNSNENQVLNTINNERKSRGLSALKFDSKLGAAANVRANEIDDRFSVYRPSGEDMSTFLNSLHMYISNGEEYLGQGNTSNASTVVAAMKNVYSYYTGKYETSGILTNGTYTKIGLAQNGNYWYFVATS